MLSTMRHSWALFALLFLVALTSAIDLGAFNIDGIEAYLHHGQKRQASGTGSTPESTAEPTSEEAPSSTPTPESTPEETPSATPTPTSEAPSSEETPSATPTPDPSSETPAPSSSARETSAPATSNNTPVSTPPPSKTSKTPVIHTTPLVSTSVENFITVITTVSNGQQVEITSSTSRTVLQTTGQALSTEAASLPDASNNGGGSGGLSESNKKIIGGVVGGVGGAILLGGLALVCWRIWGRKKRVSEDDDDLMAGTGSALGDKSAGSPNTPFQTNLEQYHNPGGRPNAAANF